MEMATFPLEYGKEILAYSGLSLYARNGREVGLLWGGAGLQLAGGR